MSAIKICAIVFGLGFLPVSARGALCSEASSPEHSLGEVTVTAQSARNFLQPTASTLFFSTYRWPADRFMRVNKSFIVSIAAVDSFDTNDLYIGDTPVAIGASYRDAVLGRLMR